MIYTWVDQNSALTCAVTSEILCIASAACWAGAFVRHLLALLHKQYSGRWCRMRESNPQLTITNGLLYHLTNPAPAQHSSSKHRIIGGFKTNHLIRRTSRHLIACSGKCLQQQGGVTTGKISPQNAYLITSILAYHAAPINQRISKNLRPCKIVNHQAMV